MGETLHLELLLKKYRPERENLLPLLQEIQGQLGYISRETMERVAEFFHLPPVEIYSVVTFYQQFLRKPSGRNPIHVCMGTACYLQGGGLIQESFARELNIKVGDKTEDGLFSLGEVACLGCCHVAPVVKIKDQIYPRMSPEKAEEVLINLREKTVSPGEKRGSGGTGD